MFLKNIEFKKLLLENIAMFICYFIFVDFEIRLILIKNFFL